jgi:hypothetical protein
MELTYEEIIMITTDILQNNPPRITGEEADKARAELEIQIAEAKAKGYDIDIPF